jgi:hypothetical protein
MLGATEGIVAEKQAAHEGKRRQPLSLTAQLLDQRHGLTATGREENFQAGAKPTNRVLNRQLLKGAHERAEV